MDKFVILDEKGKTIEEIPFNLKRRKPRKKFFDVTFVDDFREIMNNHYFQKSEVYTLKFNLCCAVADRLNTCVAYLNKHLKHPKTEEEFLSYMMFASMTRDAVDAILKEFDICPKYQNEEDYQFFKDAYLTSKVCNPDKEIPTDDKFFEYFRSLSFAHPVETDRAKFLRKELKERHYCPFVLINKSWGDPDCVGARIYTNVSKDILDVNIPFSKIKSYLKFKYEQLALATSYLTQKHQELESNWKKQVIDKTLSPLEILNEIKKRLKDRCEEYYDIDELILFLEYKSSLVQNEKPVLEFQKAIAAQLPAICDAVERIDYDSLYAATAKVLHVYPSNIKKVDYQLGCIYTDLNPSTDYARYLYTLGCLRYVMDRFAKKWVNVDEEMPADEIRLLISAASFLEENREKIRCSGTPTECNP